MKKLVVILLSVFAFVACSKDEGNYLADITTLHNTWWTEYYMRTEEYGSDGAILNIFEAYHPEYSSSTIYIGNNFIGQKGSNSAPGYGMPDKWIYSERSYVYNSATKQLKIGDSVYDVLSLSSNRIELKLTYTDSANRKKASYYVWQSTSTDKTWDEWVEYMDEENKASRDFIAKYPPTRAPIFFEVRVQNSNGEDLLNSANEGAVGLEKLVMRCNGTEYKVETDTSLGALWWNKYQPVIGLIHPQNEENYLYIGTWSQYDITEYMSVQLDWGDGDTDEFAFANSFVFDEELRFDTDKNLGYTFTRTYYYNGNVVDGVMGYDNGCVITIVK